MAFDITYHDDETMQKVYKALLSVGLDDKSIVNAITRMQNNGILFREIVADKTFKMGSDNPPYPVGEQLEKLIEEYRITEEDIDEPSSIKLRVDAEQRRIDRGY